MFKFIYKSIVGRRCANFAPWRTAVGVLLLLVAAGCGNDRGADEEQVTLLAESFIELIDAEDYDAFYERAAPIFRERQTLDEWRARAAKTREELGERKSIEFNNATYMRKPYGELETPSYVVGFHSVWEEKRIYELVTVQEQADGSWNIAGYHVLGQGQ